MAPDRRALVPHAVLLFHIFCFGLFTKMTNIFQYELPIIPGQQLEPLINQVTMVSVAMGYIFKVILVNRLFWWFLCYIFLLQFYLIAL